MNKKLLLGVFIGLGSYFLYSKFKKSKCACKDDLALPSDSSDKQTACEKQADAGMKNIRFISAEAMARYRQEAIDDCMNASEKT